MVRVSWRDLAVLCTGVSIGLILCSLFSCVCLPSPLDNVDGRAGPDGGRCVCGERLERLKRLSRLALHVGALNNTACGRSFPTASPDDEKRLREFLYPSNQRPVLSYKQQLRQYSPGSRDEPDVLEEEYIFRKNVFVGVLTQQEYLPTRAKYLYETWGKEVDKLVFFVGEDCIVPSNLTYLPIVKLQGIPDKVYPPLKKTFAVLQYIYQNYINQFNWFIRADDDVYIRSRKLNDLLTRMHPYEKVYLGRAGTGRKEDLERLRLLPFERYCMGGPGIILSIAALRELGPHLSNCLNAVLQFSVSDYNDDDVEVGRCVSRKTHVQCSSSLESRRLFQSDYDAQSLNPVTLWTNPDLRKLISIHPIKNPHNMLSVHHFYKTLDFEVSYRETEEMADYINHLCEEELPSYVAPPLSASAGCDLKLHPHLAYFNISSKMNHRGDIPNGYLVQRERVPFSLRPVNKFDLHPWTRFNDSLVQDVLGLSPQYGPQGSLKAEILHALNMLKPHLAAEFAPGGAKIRHILDGYVRFNPHLGREYIFNLKLVVDSRYSMYRRYHMVREIGPQVSVINTHLTSSSTVVNVVLPVATLDDTFEEFLKSYFHVGLQYRENKLHLIVVVSSQSLSEEVEQVLERFAQQTFAISASLVVGEGRNLRSLRAFDMGVAALESGEDLVFLADINTRFGPGFFRRCRSNTVLGKRVYFPTAFWLAQQNYKSFHDGQTPNIAPWSGKWEVYNFGLTCIYKQDYDAVGGYGDKRYGVDLFDSLLRKGLEPMQAPDPGLFRTWSKRTCSTMSSPRRTAACMEMKRSGALDQPELVDYLWELRGRKENVVSAKKERIIY